jgi:hypothetical protein
MERQQATLNGDYYKLLHAGNVAKSDHNYQKREGAKALPPPHSTQPANTTHCVASLKMSDNPRDQRKDEDSSSQSSREEDNKRGKISRVTTKIQQPGQRWQGRPVEMIT